MMISKKAKIRMICCGFTAFTLCACIPSESPVSEELIKTEPPTFSGLTNQSFTTPSVTYELVGECDPKSFGLEYAFDQTNWTKIPDGCQNSAFKINLTVAKTKTVYARAITKRGWTSSSQVIVRLVLPPTSSAFQSVTASAAQDEEQAALQYTMSSAVPGQPLSNTDFNLNSNVIGVVYGE